MRRPIVIIDEEKCDGCGDCVPSCHEGAIRVVDGKARLVADVLCDGLGACLGHCPQGAIRVEEREARPFDEAAVEAARAQVPSPAPTCPSSQLRVFQPGPSPGLDPAPAGPPSGSSLSHWPVQLALLHPAAPVLRGASLLLAADCVPVADPRFHADLLPGRAVALGCPKLDEVEPYVQKLAAMIAANGLKEITVARMEVPCCGGLLAVALEARRRAGSDVAVRELVVGIRGERKGLRTVAGAEE